MPKQIFRTGMWSVESWGRSRLRRTKCLKMKVEGGGRKWSSHCFASWWWYVEVDEKMAMKMKVWGRGRKCRLELPLFSKPLFSLPLLLLPLTKGTKGCPSSHSFSPAADFGWNIFSLWLTCIGAPPTPKIEGMVKPVQCCFFWVTSLAFGIFPIFGIF